MLQEACSAAMARCQTSSAGVVNTTGVVIDMPITIQRCLTELTNEPEPPLLTRWRSRQRRGSRLKRSLFDAWSSGSGQQLWASCLHPLAYSEPLRFSTANNCDIHQVTVLGIGQTASWWRLC